MTQELAPNGKAKVTVELVGLDSNAFSILGRCSKAMRRAGWTAAEIKEFQAEATNGDYNHLLATVLSYCEDASEVDDDYGEDDLIDEDEWDDEEGSPSLRGKLA